MPYMSLQFNRAFRRWLGLRSETSAPKGDRTNRGLYGIPEGMPWYESSWCELPRTNLVGLCDRLLWLRITGHWSPTP